jgi:hypothetical protein
VPDAATPRQAALWFAARGYPVFPLHSITDNGACTCGSSACDSPGKHPYAPFAPNGFKNATCDGAIIKAWFDEHYWLNYGVVTDPFVVIDADTKHDGLKKWAALCSDLTRPLIHTWQVRTGSGGLHVMFKNPSKIRCGELDEGIQVKAAGGYIVGVTSKHKSGKQYAWLPQCSPADTPLDEPPAWLLAVINARSHHGRPTSLQDWRKMANTNVPEGERTKTLCKIAGHLLHYPLLDPIMVRDLLIGWDRGMCEPPLGAKRVMEIVEGFAPRNDKKRSGYE